MSDSSVAAFGGAESILFAMLVGVGLLWLRWPGRGGVVWAWSTSSWAVALVLFELRVAD